MTQLYAIGEALIDFIPAERDTSLKEVSGFSPQVGGAPANVASGVAKLGKNAALITQLGHDAFGDKIIELLQDIGVDTKHVYQTNTANTALAFVSLSQAGERDFAFYRKPSADMLLEAQQIEHLQFESTDILHFCSVDLVESPMKQTHIAVIDKMLEANGTVVFDPNLRFPLWESKAALKQTVNDFIEKAHILKISDEELSFITGIEDEAQAIASLFRGNVEIVIYTKGKNGAALYTKEGEVASASGFNVTVQDTTGAGDAFISAMIYQLLGHSRNDLVNQAEKYLHFANAVAALTTTQYGAIESIPTLSEVEKLLKETNE